MAVPDHGQNPFVLVGAVRLDLYRLASNQVVEVFPGLLAEGLAGLAPMGDLGRVDPEEADTEPGATGINGGHGVAVGDVVGLRRQGAGGGGEDKPGNLKPSDLLMVVYYKRNIGH